MDKQELRERIWDALEESGEARFPFPPHGRIPNFAGADDAAAALAATDAWEATTALKSNPDAPQRPVRRGALEAGKTVYVAVPRLADPDPFVELDPARIDDYDRATTISGAPELGRQVGPEAVGSLAMIVVGSVAVNEAGARIGKGEGYSDLEYAVLRELDLVDDQTTVVTTVHETQVVEESWPVEEHDVPLDLIVTPERVIATNTEFERPTGIYPERIDPGRIAEIPVLDDFLD